jgi:hypothetical protein
VPRSNLGLNLAAFTTSSSDGPRKICTALSPPPDQKLIATRFMPTGEA